VISDVCFVREQYVGYGYLQSDAELGRVANDKAECERGEWIQTSVTQTSPRIVRGC
jgi:hypothetical protein